MRLVDVNRLPADATLARDVRTGPLGTAPLLRAGVPVTPDLKTRLNQRGIRSVWVDDELSKDIEPLEPLSPEVREEAETTVRETLDRARHALEHGQGLQRKDLIAVEEVAAAIAAELVANPEAVLALGEMGMADAYTHEHSLRVTTLGLLIGARHYAEHGWVDWKGTVRRDGIRKRLTQLGIGLLVHDLGKLAVPPEVLNKPGKLDDDEWAIMKQHPDMGVAMLNEATTSYLALSVVRSHHERWDGTGYPQGLSGDDITEFARIAAIADVYDAVCSDRPYKEAAPPHVGVDLVVGGSGTLFDPVFVRTFRKVVHPWPVGSEVHVDGRVGVVVDVHPLRPDQPRVRFAGGDEVDVDLRAALASAA